MKTRTTKKWSVFTFMVVVYLGFQGFIGTGAYGDEGMDRQVDQVALQSQDLAVKKLKLLIKKYQGSSEEPALLLRLADIYQESAEIEFRIAHGKVLKKKGQAPNLAKYRAILGDLVQILGTIMSKGGSNFPSLDRCYFMRAQALVELGQKQSAKNDYVMLVTQFPFSSHVLSAYMTLADMAIEENKHPEAIGYLQHVEKHPESPQYPYALYKLAWSYYNTKDFGQAMSHIERQIKYYDDLNARQQGLSSADSAMRENSLMDTVLFYLDGNEAGNKEYTVTGALDFFKSIEKGKLLGKMNLRFGKLLRSHRRDADLNLWKEIVLKEVPELPETIDVVSTLFEHQMNQQKLDEAALTCQDFIALHRKNKPAVVSSESYVNVRKALIETAAQLQTRIVKAKNQGNIQPWMKTLGAIYSAFIQMVPEDDPRVAQAHYNLAETLYEIGEYDRSTQNYTWVLDHWNPKSGMNRMEIAIKAIASKYEVLKTKQLIPENLVALKLVRGTVEEMEKKLPKELASWLAWVDFLAKQPIDKNLEEKAQFFEFEGNRAIYAQGSTWVACERLYSFVTKNPQSKYASPAATLILDSYIKSELWKETYTVATRFMKITWPEAAFLGRLRQVAADSGFKLAEIKFQQKDYEGSIAQAKSVVQTFPDNSRAADAILMMAKAYSELKQPKMAEQYYSQLIEKFPAFKDRGVAILARAGLAEQDYNFAQAIRDYQLYLQLPSLSGVTPEQKDQIKQRVYLLGWIDGGIALKCEDSSSAVCEKFKALTTLKNTAQNANAVNSDDLLRQAIKGVKENRPIWALAALKYSEDLEYRDRLLLIRNVARGWDQLDPLVQLALLDDLTSILPQAFEKARVELKKVVPMNHVTANSVTRRAEWIKEIETTATLALGLPWSKIRASVLFELAQTYSDFSDALSSASPPKDISPAEEKEYQKSVQEIVNPFKEKSANLAKKAYQMAADTSVDGDVLNKIMMRYSSVLKASAQDATDKIRKKIPDYKQYENLVLLDLNLLKLTDQEAVLQAASGGRRPESDVGSRLRQLWIESYQKKAWAKNAYILQEMKDRKVVPPSSIKLMRGLMLAAVGAKSEALIEIQGAAADLPIGSQALMLTKTKKKLFETVLSHYIRSAAIDSSIQLAHEIETLNQQIKQSEGGKRI